MSKIPIYTTGDIGKPSRKVSPDSIENPIFVSSYSGKILPRHPTFRTKTDDPTGKKPVYHGGLLINANTMLCHSHLYEAPDNQQFRR